MLYGHVFRNAMLIVVSGFPGAFIGAFFTGALSDRDDFFARRAWAALLRVDRQSRLPGRLCQSLYFRPARSCSVNLISDLTYTWIDPRIDFETREV